MSEGSERYVLVGRTVVPEPDLWTWAEWFERSDRRVRLTRVGPYEVSTVFLGLDHNFLHRGPPLLFETMVFLPGMTHEPKWLKGHQLPEWLETQERCSTWGEAEEQHARVVRELVEIAGDQVVELYPVEALAE